VKGTNVYNSVGEFVRLTSESGLRRGDWRWSRPVGKVRRTVASVRNRPSGGRRHGPIPVLSRCTKYLVAHPVIRSGGRTSAVSSASAFQSGTGRAVSASLAIASSSARRLAKAGRETPIWLTFLQPNRVTRVYRARFWAALTRALARRVCLLPPLQPSRALCRAGGGRARRSHRAASVSPRYW
jgi:hypothetical protein